jgi:hypothetical protein
LPIGPNVQLSAGCGSLLSTRRGLLLLKPRYGGEEFVGELMKRVSLLAFVAASFFGFVQPTNAAPARDVVQEATVSAREVRAKEELIRELAGMGAIDLEIRRRFLALRKDATPAERAQLDDVWSREYRPFDQRNTARLKELLARRGWFTRSEVGERTSGMVFQIVQHSGDLELMKTVLQKLEALRGTPDFDGEEYALLYDRLATMEKRPQRYGTQGTDCAGGKYARPSNLEDPVGLDRRRAEMGLQPMDDYLAALDRMYGACAHRS